MSLYGMLAPAGKSGFGYSATAEQVTAGLSLEGQTILVTGCNSGLGQEAARVLSLRGARVVGTARSLAKAQAACEAWPSALPFNCDLADPASVRACAARLAADGVHLDAIICNAGIMALPKLERAHGLELQFFTNHIGHFLLVTALLEQLTASARVVVLSSAAHAGAPRAGIEFDNLDGSKGYSPWAAYGQSKLANLLFAKELARKFAGSQRTANAVHPGVIRTNLFQHMNPALALGLAAIGPLAMKSVSEGAATEVYVATHPSLAGVSGSYFANCNLARPRKDAEDAALARRLWEVSERIVRELPA